jgi:hypothetical protein
VPCPSGWNQTTSNDADQLEYCEPWPLSGKPACDPVSAIFPGDAACSPIGDPCPAGDYATGLPAASPILYVMAGAAAGGSGSMAAPFGTLQEAMAHATPGTILALGRGRFAESIALGDGVTLWGACVGASTVAGSIALAPGAHQGALKDLTVTQSPSDAVIDDQPGSTLSLDGVLIDRAGALGIHAVSATISGHDVLVRGSTRYGVVAESGGTISLARADIASSRDDQVLAASGGEVILSDAAIHDPTTPPR